MFTHRCTTLTFKALFHIPLCTRIEEGNCFSRVNVSQRPCVPFLFVRGCEVEGDVRLARMIHYLLPNYVTDLSQWRETGVGALVSKSGLTVKEIGIQLEVVLLSGTPLDSGV